MLKLMRKHDTEDNCYLSSPLETNQIFDSMIPEYL